MEGERNKGDVVTLKDGTRYLRGAWRRDVTHEDLFGGLPAPEKPSKGPDVIMHADGSWSWAEQA